MTPLSPSRPALFGIAGALLCAGGLLLVGCDGSGSKQASLYERLTNTGPWTIGRLEGSGFDFESRLDRRYPRGIEIVFHEGDETRTYEIRSQRPDGLDSTVTRGPVRLFRDNSLQMASGFEGQGSVTWRYSFPTTSRAIFEVRRGSENFLNVLFSESNRTPDLKMTLVAGED